MPSLTVVFIRFLFAAGLGLGALFTLGMFATLNDKREAGAAAIAAVSCWALAWAAWGQW